MADQVTAKAPRRGRLAGTVTVRVYCTIASNVPSGPSRRSHGSASGRVPCEDVLAFHTVGSVHRGVDSASEEAKIELAARWGDLEQMQAEFLERLPEAAFQEPRTYENSPGTPWTYPLLQHLMNHSTYHRGQVTTLLRQLGAGAEATDLLVFVDEEEPGR